MVADKFSRSSFVAENFKALFRKLLFKLGIPNLNKCHKSSIKHKVGKIRNQGQDCFIITTLYEFAHIENFQYMFTKSLRKRQTETVCAFQIRIRLQSQLKTIIEQIQDGKEVPNQQINELRKTLVDIGFNPPLTKIQKILSWLFPRLLSYQSGDLFELYNTIRYQLDEKDYYIPTLTHDTDNFFQLYNPNLSPANSLIHLFFNKEEDMSLLLHDNILSAIPKASRAGVKINANWKNQKKGIVPIITSSNNQLDLTLVQCTLPKKLMGIWNIGYHSMSFLKKDHQWYSCSDHRIKPIRFDEVRDSCAKGLLHLHYQLTLGKRNT